MQLSIFSAPTAQAVSLRTTRLPELSEVAAQVGAAEQWVKLTLSEVLELWGRLYEDFVAVLDEPIQYARGFSQEHSPQFGEGGPLARKFYRREYERLVQGQRQLRATAENLFCANLLTAIKQGQAFLRAHGLSEDEAEDSHEFFNEVIQRPAAGDLAKPLPVLMQDLAEEYLRLKASAAPGEEE